MGQPDKVRYLHHAGHTLLRRLVVIERIVIERIWLVGTQVILP